MASTIVLTGITFHGCEDLMVDNPSEYQADFMVYETTNPYLSPRNFPSDIVFDSGFHFRKMNTSLEEEIATIQSLDFGRDNDYIGVWSGFFIPNRLKQQAMERLDLAKASVRQHAVVDRNWKLQPFDDSRPLKTDQLYVYFTEYSDLHIFTRENQDGLFVVIVNRDNADSGFEYTFFQFEGEAYSDSFDPNLLYCVEDEDNIGVDDESFFNIYPDFHAALVR